MFNKNGRPVYSKRISAIQDHAKKVKKRVEVVELFMYSDDDFYADSDIDYANNDFMDKEFF